MFPLDPNAPTPPSASVPMSAAATVGRDSAAIAAAVRAPTLLDAAAIGGSAWLERGILRAEAYANGIGR